MQDTIGLYPSNGIEGLTADSGLKNSMSYAVAEDIIFGRAVVYDGNKVKYPDADTDKVAGIVQFEQNEDGLILAGEAGSVLSKGRIYVKQIGVTASVVGGAVYIDVAGLTGQVTTLATANIAVPNARFLTATAQNDLAIVELNLP